MQQPLHNSPIPTNSAKKPTGYKPKTQNGEPLVSLSSLFGDRPLPHAPEVERSVIGMLLNPFSDPKATIFDLIRTPEVFHLPQYSHVYRAALELEASGSPVDMMTLTEKLRGSGTLDAVGGPFGLAKMGADVTSDGMVESYCRILLERYNSRRMIQIGIEAVTKGLDPATDCFELIEATQSAVTGLVTGLGGSTYLNSPTLAKNALESIREIMQKGNRLTGVPTGYAEMDALSNGWQPGHLIILAARPAVGKTALALQFGLHAALAGVGAGLFSLEMGADELTMRQISALSGIYMDWITKGRLSESHLKGFDDAAAQFARLPFYVDDSFSLDLYTLRSKARRMVQKDGVKLLVIDYLQLMQGMGQRSNGNREQEIASITRGLKSLAKELHVPIIALSQVNRSIDGRGNKTPQLSDLRESGAIEQDANIVMFLSQKHSHLSAEELAQLSDDQKLEALVSIAKNRGGKTGEILMYFDKDCQRWFDVPGYDRHTGKAPAWTNSNATMHGAFQRKTANDFESF